jgi:S-adenosylmethionine:tRNA ribosyltransferase-isomerase
MIAAKEPRALREAARMLMLDSNRRSFTDSAIAELPAVLRPGDLIVVNDAATLPASLPATAPSGSPVELRLVRRLDGSDWRAVLMGEGDWRIPTELRDPPESLNAGSVLRIAEGFEAEVIAVASESSRLVTVRFSRKGPEMWNAIYAFGRPIQYSYVQRDLAIWSVQTIYGSRPWAAEMPSAGYPLTWRILLELKRRGIGIACLTHAAGLSAAGDDDLDRRLPLSESFEIPRKTVDDIETTRSYDGRVIAIGTTVVRALEGCAATHQGRLAAGEGETSLIIDRTFHRRVVDGILTGIHDPAQSHFHLLRAFADETMLRRAWRHAAEAGYLCHEFGDLCLIT